MIRVINRNRLINEFAEELACIQNEADFWYYILHDQEMSSFVLDTLGSSRDLAYRLGILDEVYKQALTIYDFSQSGKDGFRPDLEYIEQMHQRFEEQREHQLVF